MHWTRPKTTGTPPPHIRAHTATAVDKRIFVFGGGADAKYYNDTWVFDTIRRHWTRVGYTSVPSARKSEGARSIFSDSFLLSLTVLLQDPTLPIPRRAHTTWYYRSKLWLFGGGNGAEALNDLWVLDVDVPYDKMRWVRVPVEDPNFLGGLGGVVNGAGEEAKRDKKAKTRRKRSGTVTGAKDTGREPGDGGEVDEDEDEFGSSSGSSEHPPSQQAQRRPCSQQESNSNAATPAKRPIPSPRGYHTATLVGDCVVVIGGSDGKKYFEDIWVLNLCQLPFSLLYPGC